MAGSVRSGAVGAARKFDSLARNYREHDYADPDAYAVRRARAIAAAAPRSEPGESLLDLGCGDGNMAPPLLALGLGYRGIDASPAMVEEARRRNPGVEFSLADFERYEPPEPVDVVICLRSLYLVPDPLALFRLVHGYTRRKFVFDFKPSVRDPQPLVEALREAGFADVELRPFFLPQRRKLPHAVLPLVTGLERSGPVARVLLRRVGIVLCAARP
jgi:SAM-dependent methyltransferase